MTLEVHPEKRYTDCIIPKWPLKAGRYSYNLFAENKGEVFDSIRDAGTLGVEDGEYYGSGCLPAPGQAGVLVDYTWTDSGVQ